MEKIALLNTAGGATATQRKSFVLLLKGKQAAECINDFLLKNYMPKLTFYADFQNAENVLCEDTKAICYHRDSGITLQSIALILRNTREKNIPNVWVLDAEGEDVTPILLSCEFVGEGAVDKEKGGNGVFSYLFKNGKIQEMFHHSLPDAVERLT